uniref:MD-2-related lipid-recognition domain-containing protein n=1 Tax=Periophthalmus magnuspinnatus TaxID=409849 RepID=A0A3B4BGQ3_9GOBI
SKTCLNCTIIMIRLIKSMQVLGFEWKNCGKPDDPAVLNTLNVAPDPISIPGQLKADASGRTAVELISPLALNMTIEKAVAGFWVKIPCVDDMGSCHYSDACDVLNMLVPPGQDCPEPLHAYGLPCRCPFKAGLYSLPPSDFFIPNLDLPYWLTNGKYRARGMLGQDGAELGCLELGLTIHSG